MTSRIDIYIESIREELTAAKDSAMSGELDFRFILTDGGVRRCSVEVRRDLQRRSKGLCDKLP